MTGSFKSYNRLSVIVLMAGFLSTMCGCVAKRGVDFGHWALQGERINTMRVFLNENANGFTGNERILLLPPVGDMPEENRHQLQNNIRQEMINYFNTAVSTISGDGYMSDYLQEQNLLLTSDQINTQEAGRIGQLLGATHVLCVLVREFRPYHPQVLALGLVMVETESHMITAEMDASFNAAQQEVLMAADRHMQSRLAREYNAQNLDIMLRSPSQYSAFVSANCCRVLAEALYRKNITPLRNDENKPIEAVEQNQIVD